MSAKTLIAYYSMTGHTRRIANEVRDVTGAELEEISEPRPRQGFAGVLRALFDGVARRTPPILVGSHNPADYDLLVIGGPVWAGRMAAPVRSYAKRYGASAPHVAFFCTEGGRGAEAAFADLEKLCRHPPEATLVVDAAHLPAIEHHVALRRFTSTLTSTRH
ncbi:MAG: flavodoxin family protein [Lysobacter sp.]